MDYQISNANYKLADVPSGIANAAQPHALNVTPARVYKLWATLGQQCK
jgi:hypothetical protein